MRTGPGALVSLLRHHLALDFTLFQKAPGLLDKVQKVAGGQGKEKARKGCEKRVWHCLLAVLPTHL